MDRSMEPTCTWEEDGEGDLRKHGRGNSRHAAVPSPPQVAGAVVGAALGTDVYNAGLYLVAQHGDPRDGRLGVGSEGAAQISHDDQAAINAALELDEAAATSAAACGGTTYDAGILLVGQHGDPREGTFECGYQCDERAETHGVNDRPASFTPAPRGPRAAAAGAGQRRPVGFANTANCFAGLADNDEDVVREDEEEVPLKRRSAKKQKVRAPGSAEKTRAGEAKPDQADEA